MRDKKYNDNPDVIEKEENITVLIVIDLFGKK